MKDLQREKTRQRVKRYRERQKSVTSVERYTKRDVTLEMVPPSYVYGTAGRYQFLPERPRYLTLSDGQVLDRLGQPSSNIQIRAMNMCNEVGFNYHPTKTIKK